MTKKTDKRWRLWIATGLNIKDKQRVLMELTKGFSSEILHQNIKRIPRYLKAPILISLVSFAIFSALHFDLYRRNPDLWKIPPKIKWDERKVTLMDLAYLYLKSLYWLKEKIMPSLLEKTTRLKFYLPLPLSLYYLNELQNSLGWLV